MQKKKKSVPTNGIFQIKVDNSTLLIENNCANVPSQILFILPNTKPVGNPLKTQIKNKKKK